VLVAHCKSTACVGAGAALESYCRERERERRLGLTTEEWRLGVLVEWFFIF
jgi:hypothetical protein